MKSVLLKLKTKINYNLIILDDSASLLFPIAIASNLKVNRETSELNEEMQIANKFKKKMLSIFSH